MGIEAMVIAQVASAIMGANAASEEAKLNTEQDLSAEKSRAMKATMEFNDMVAANKVLYATSGASMSSATFLTAINNSDMNFRLNRASDRITTGNKVRGHKMKAKQAKTRALFSAATSIIGGYQDAKALSNSQADMPSGTGRDTYFGIKIT